MQAEVADILRRARATLGAAQQGLRDCKDPARRLAGLRNVVVFGRAVTNVIESLRNKADGFDAWYDAVSADLRSDEMMKFLYRLRSQILKQGEMRTAGYARIGTISTADIARLPRPPNATTFFIGDEAGGSGWQVEIAPGIIEKYYVDLPGDFEVKTGLTFRDAPADTANERDAIELCAHYLQRMEQIVADAEKRWSPPKS